ncbi:radical SAM family heme chaperone HemW [Spiribacter vilamensis]|uniref:Heme chaperone HemW n=1 Tax=Spiribacter vilamensis TaxID=531306 RepID=A0A4Q8D1V7_9GAMM|nr:radical SAM family heme chaperone HemW [Spiribacter vilamensis]RZU99257.1 oxygen-independent coproporphyrinogen-3 oxidase [Spiribacter vilamensis]TVO61758.1 radical SAM family heme chaperone HemW [Spiribacter vilamensis]
MAATLTPPPLGLYIHLPWCVQKCPYCDFNSHALRGELPEQAYTDALLRDADREAIAAGGRAVETLFIGGGTPSLFSADAIQTLLDGLRQRLNIARDAEITLEANPGTLESGRFEGFLVAGVNRLSIGVQSFNDQRLQRLGRIHGGDEATRAIATARRAGFERINVDLMHGLPGQSPAEALADVEQVMALGIEHLSHYQLTLEPGTAFHARPPALPDDDQLADIEAACAERIHAAGLRRYEVSAWATPGDECRHNLNYWRFGDYLAIGAGGHGKLSHADGGIRRYRKQHLPRLYQEQAGTETATVEDRAITADERPLEYLMNALRLTDGTDLRAAMARTGLPASAFEPGLTEARRRGLLIDDPTRLQVTPLGQRFLNDLLDVFLEAETPANRVNAG